MNLARPSFHKLPIPRRRPALQAALILGCLLSAHDLFAERYLASAEAQKLCFPQASHFEELVIRFTPEQVKAIEKRSSLKVPNLGNRLWVARRDTNLLGVLLIDQVLGKHELIDYAVAINPAGHVLQIEVLQYRESHGREIRGQKWREQFAGKNLAAPLKLHDDIYNISGATISCRHVTEGVKRLLATYEVVVRPRLLPAGRLPDATAPPARR